MAENDQGKKALNDRISDLEDDKEVTEEQAAQLADALNEARSRITDLEVENKDLKRRDEDHDEALTAAYLKGGVDAQGEIRDLKAERDKLREALEAIRGLERTIWNGKRLHGVAGSHALELYMYEAEKVARTALDSTTAAPPAVDVKKALKVIHQVHIWFQSKSEGVQLDLLSNGFPLNDLIADLRPTTPAVDVAKVAAWIWDHGSYLIEGHACPRITFYNVNSIRLHLDAALKEGK
jgi:hypothetical protein